MFSTTKVTISLLTSLLTFLAIELMEDLLMHRDSTAFRNRFERWKNGELVYENGRVIPGYETGKDLRNTNRPEPILTADKSNSDFIERLKANWRQEIWDWERSGKAVTHKMASADNIVYPNVQTTAGGGLIDFTNPIWEGVIDPYERAIRTKDYVPMKTEQDAIWFGPNYKKYYPKFKDGKPGYETGKNSSKSKDGTRYLLDELTGKFNRITADEMANQFADLTVTPNKNRIDIKSNPVYHDPRLKYAGYVTEAMLEDERNAQRQRETSMYAPGLELTYPEFDIISGVRGSGIGKIFQKKPININIKNAHKITPEQWDKAYITAINNRNILEAQRLRDLHFIANTKGNKAVNIDGTPIKQYHTVADEYDPNFTEFNPNIENLNSSIYTTDNSFMSGTYSSHILSEAERDHIIEMTRKRELYDLNQYTNPDDFIRNQIKLYLNPKKARKKILSDHKWVALPADINRQKRLYTYLRNPVEVDAYGRPWAHLPIHTLPEDVFKNIRVDLRGGIGNWYSTRSLEDAIRKLDYDGAIIKNVLDYGGSKRYFGPEIMNYPGTVFLIKNPKNIKLADTITYDDAGNIIPLSKRDNFKIKDIRYGLIPTLGIGSGYALNK